MARFLHMTTNPVGVGVGALLWMVLLAACGPIEAEKKIFRSPYIDPASVQPERRVFQFVAGDQNDTQEFRVKPYDPNREQELVAAWFTGSTFEIQRTLDRTSEDPTELNGETYFEFNAAEQEFNPCRLVQTGETSVTISVYIADRSFQTVAGDEIVVEEGGHVVEHTWIAQPQNCRRQ